MLGLVELGKGELVPPPILAATDATRLPAALRCTLPPKLRCGWKAIASSRRGRQASPLV